MHSVTKLEDIPAQTPDGYQANSAGFRRLTYVNRAIGSVHMGTGVCSLDASGVIDPHVHSFEETFYILEGAVIVLIGNEARLLKPGDFGLISTGVVHGWRCADDQSARWLEMQSPQPRTADYGRDTFFVGSEVPYHAAPLDPAGGSNAILGHFDESRLPRPGAPSEMEGFNPTTGVAIKMFVDRSFGAIHQSLFLIQYMPGAKIDPHDHAFEESYFIVSGEVEARADGEVHHLGQGA